MARGPVLPAWFPGASSLWCRAPRLCPSQPAGFWASGGGKPPFLPPFDSVLFPGSLSSWQQLAQWRCCRYWKLLASPVCSSLSASLWFPFLPRSLVVSFEQRSVRPGGVESHGPPAAPTWRACCPCCFPATLSLWLQPVSFPGSVPKCVIPGLLGDVCSVVTKL